MKIGVVSDTHIPNKARKIPETLLQGLAGVDLILHAGDLVSATVLQTLQAIAPVEAVAGNMDAPNLAYQLGRKKLLHLAGYNIGLIHGDGIKGTTIDRAQAAFPEAQCIVFGHSHMPYNAFRQGVYMFNPGSPTDRRSSPQFSYGLLYLEQAGIRGEIIYFG